MGDYSGLSKVLILLSTYNGEAYLNEQLNSILSQNDVEVDLLIRDDGSLDSTIEILNKFEQKNRNIKVYSGKNVGCAESYRILLNSAYGLEKSYDFYAFADQDDVWLPEKLYVACENLKKLDNNIPSLYCSNLKVVDEQLNEIGMKYSNDQKLVSKGESLVCSMATGCTMVFNQKVIEYYHDYPPRKMILHDLWILHMCIFGGNVVYDKNAYILYRQHNWNVVGAKMTIKSQFKVKINSLKTFFSQHENENEAKEILNTYSSLLSLEDYKLVDKVASYRCNRKKWLQLLFGLDEYSKNIRRQHNNWIFKIRVLLRHV